jgi:parallel beta-helix repeat protein
MIQAYDDGLNAWDNGYPGGGNLWSDYSGLDNLKGPGQNESGSDGIGDTPYLFDFSQDNYPLKPWLTGYVHNIDKDTVHSTIMGGVTYADPGNTLVVGNATYYENVNIDKSLTLIGEDRNTTIIDGGGAGDVVHITADWVNITGFTVTNSGINIDDVGIELEGVNNCTVNGNIFKNNYNGVRITSSITKVAKKITNNTYSESYPRINANGQVVWSGWQ